MEKQQFLSELKQMVLAGQVSQAEVMATFSEALVPPTPVTVESNSLKLSEVMYYIGGTIVFLGICVLISENWSSFTSPLRILVTLGSSVAAFVVGALMYRYENLRKVSQAFFLIAGMLAPLGMNVALRESGIDTTFSALPQLLVYLILTTVFLGGLKFFRQQTILLFFGIIFATGIFHFIINLMVGDSLLLDNYYKIWQYRILAAGMAWVFLGYYLSFTSYKAVTGALYGFGVLGFLGSAIALGGWIPSQNVFWELIYPLLVFGVIFSSVYLKSKSFLVFGVIFLIAYILKLTGEYFTSGLGWPLALVLAGLAIMGVGYYAVRFNQKYFAHTV